MPKVIIAMSGGVDSSVAAAILKNRGYNVIGIFMKFFTPPSLRGGDLRENKCCSLEAKLDAKRVAVKLGIPLYVVDAQKEFKKKVVDYFIDEYKRGNTPNPCVECNRYIKFKVLMDKAMKFDADYIATGHYARVKKNKLLTAKDIKKDQSYFLWQLTQRELSKITFPLGDYTKEEVRKMAKEFGLPVYNKKDSQEVCFVSGADIRGFLKSRIHAEKGPIINTEGEKIGEHKGLIFYTIGQRKGLPATPASWLAWRAGYPVYVVGKNPKKNALIVSKQQKDLLQKEMIVKNMNWLSGRPYFGKCKVKIRSMVYPPAQAEILRRCGRAKMAKVIFNKPQRAITSGQSAVFYLNGELLGGGIIM